LTARSTTRRFTTWIPATMVPLWNRSPRCSYRQGKREGWGKPGALKANQGLRRWSL